MRYLIFFILIASSLSASIKFEDKFKLYELGKPIASNKIFYMGISYDGKPNKLVNIFDILINGNDQNKIVSEEGRYIIFEGCKPRDCASKGMLWIDTKDKIAIGVIKHSFWEALDFSKYKPDQIFIFSNFLSNSNSLPDKFINDYKEWFLKYKFKPSVIRFLSSKDKIEIISEIK